MRLPFRIRLPFRRKKKRVRPDSAVDYVFRKLKEAREMKKEETARFVVMGIGNDLKGDDGVGWYVIEKLRKGLGQRYDIHLITASVPENHVSEVRNFHPDVLIMVDSAEFKGSPGEVRLIGEKELADNIGGTHTTPVTLFMKLLMEDPGFTSKIVFIGIQKKQTAFGTPMSKNVKKTGKRIAGLIEKLYRKGVLDKEIEKEITLLKGRNPLKRMSKLVDRAAEAGRVKKE